MPGLNRPQPILNRNLLTITATIVVLSAVLAFLSWKDNSATESTTADEPDLCVTAMLQAAQNGDVDAYLNCFAGDLRNKLKSRLADKPTEQVAAELRSSIRGLTGQTTTELEYQGEGLATLVHERLYTDEKEVYRARLQRFGADWRIVELKSLGRVALEIPVGTPVYVPLPEEDQDG